MSSTLPSLSAISTLSWCSQKGKLELQQLLLLLKPEPEWLSLVAGGLQSCSHLVAKFQITVHKPLHIPTNEHVRVQQCFIHNGLLRLGNQYQIPIRGGGVDRRLQGRIQRLFRFSVSSPLLLHPPPQLECSDSLFLKGISFDLFLSFHKTCTVFACRYTSS